MPDHEIKTLVPTALTRWGNQFLQITRNCELRPGLEPTVQKYVREHKNEKEAIIETDESDGSSKAGKPVAASELGLSTSDWEQSAELEGFLYYPFQIKESLEKRSFLHGAQALALLYDLKENFCNPYRHLEVRAFPASLTIADRKRPTEKKESGELSSMIDTVRSVVKDELQERCFVNRPSNARMVLCFMSKQMSCKIYFTPQQYQLAETLYKQMLRKAEEIAGKTAKPNDPPSKRVKVEKPVEEDSMLFRGSFEEDAEESNFDAVTDEMERWKYVAPEEIKEYRCPDGLLNEFKMFWHLRHRFPLHFLVFKQIACHLPHEANVEQYFSRAGLLSDPNMDPAYLGVLVMVGANKKKFKPMVAAIMERYYAKYRGKGGLEEGEVVQSSPGGEEAGPSSAPVPAPSSVPAAV